MGATYSQEQLSVLSALQGVMAIHPVEIPEKELRDLLLWVRCNYPHSESHLLFEPGFWQEINRHLYHLATKKDRTALKLLSPARVMLEAISRNTTGTARHQQAANIPPRVGGGESPCYQVAAVAPANPGGAEIIPTAKVWEELSSPPGSPGSPDIPLPVPRKLKLEIFPSELEYLDFAFFEACYQSRASPQRRRDHWGGGRRRLRDPRESCLLATGKAVPRQCQAASSSQGRLRRQQGGPQGQQ